MPSVKLVKAMRRRPLPQGPDAGNRSFLLSPPSHLQPDQMQSPDDIQSVLEDSNKYKGIEGVVIICEDKMGITGKLELVPVL